MKQDKTLFLLEELHQSVRCKVITTIIINNKFAHLTINRALILKGYFAL